MGLRLEITVGQWTQQNQYLLLLQLVNAIPEHEHLKDDTAALTPLPPWSRLFVGWKLDAGASWETNMGSHMWFLCVHFYLIRAGTAMLTEFSWWSWGFDGAHFGFPKRKKVQEQLTYLLTCDSAFTPSSYRLSTGTWRGNWTCPIIATYNVV